MISGNFAGDESDDVAAVYAYANNAKVFVFESTSNLFGDGWVTVHNGKGSYLAPNMQYSVFGGNVTGGGYDEIVSLYKQTSRESSIYKFEANSSGTFYLYNNLWNSQIYEISSDTASTSTRVASETIGDDVYTYTYDVLGNITEIKKNGNAYRSYKYDALGELIREDNVDSDRTYKYTYNNRGNITSHKEYGYASPGTEADDYIDSITINYNPYGWKDRIFHIDYEGCNYDAVGNPYIYFENELEWTDGRLLTKFYAVYTDDITSYTYNSNGIRTSKTYNNYEDQYVITHEYLLDGSKIICEKINCNDSDPTIDILLHFYYDASGNIFAFEYDDDMYYYVRNILGEILGIIDTDGSYVVKYTYDAWGKPLSITDGAGIDVSANSSHIANINPFRYKGYYYDTETGFYYLQSRYYDPYVGRFINADSFVSTGTGFLGYNMFAYCNNCPVMLKDEFGYIPVFSASFEEETDEQRKEAVENMHVYFKNLRTYIPDVSDRIDNFLEPYIQYAENNNYKVRILEHFPFICYFNALKIITESLLYFKDLNANDGVFDFKSRQGWGAGVKGHYPGKNRLVKYHNYYLTLEDLGNYIYGYHGAANCFDISILLFGSDYAAGFPTEGPEFINELHDQNWIIIGYDDYMNSH